VNEAVDAAIAVLAARQLGNVTRDQLVASGLSDDAIRHRVELGRLHRVHRGVYAVGRRPVTPLERASAAVLACGPGAALSHRSAMALWGVLKRWETPLHITVTGDRRPHGMTVHRCTTLAGRDLTTQLGIRVTSPARTVLDCALGLNDKALTRAISDLRHARVLHIPALADAVERFPTHAGTRRVKAALRTPGGPTRSEFEDAFPAFCGYYDLPEPVMAPTVAGYEVDAFFRAERVIVELDSWEFHSGRDAFETDRNRDADTLAAGHVTVRITWERLLHTPSDEATRLHTILQARRRRAA
jgi:hypothetical protein